MNEAVQYSESTFSFFLYQVPFSTLLHFKNVQDTFYRCKDRGMSIAILTITNIIKHYLHVCCRLQHNLLDSVKVQTIIQAAGCKANTATQPG